MGTVDRPLEVVLPVGETVHVTLDSVDVNHAFYVPAFLFKRDAIPGSPTAFDLQVVRAGRVPGRLRGVLRRWARPDAIHDPGRRPGDLRRLARGAAGEPGDSVAAASPAP